MYKYISTSLLLSKVDVIISCVDVYEKVPEKALFPKKILLLNPLSDGFKVSIPIYDIVDADAIVCLKGVFEKRDNIELLISSGLTSLSVLS